MKLWTFIKSPSGNLAVFAGFILLGGVLVFRSYARDNARAEQLTKIEATAPETGRQSILRDGSPLKVPEIFTPATRAETASGGESRPRAARDRAASSKSPAALPISLFAGNAASDAKDLSKNYAPYGRLIPCETVVTLESSRLDTPVIGLVTEDVWHDGRLVIPAGAEVHGRAALDRSRERIAAAGRWVVVWRDGSSFNGTELVLSGIALDRQRNDVTGEFGMRDGSAGLAGQLIRSDNWQEVKLFASTFLAGMASGLQEMRNQGTAFGNVPVPVASGKNAALQGTADVLNLYAKQIQEVIARDGFYVRVPAGKQFYLYVTETVDQAKGVRGNVRNEEIWRTQNETKNN
jgi:hypothetical protein